MKSIMRILVDIRHLSVPNISGVGGYTRSLLHALFEIDKENDYVLLSSGTKHPSLEIHNKERISHVHVPVPNKLLNLRTLLLRHPTINWHVREPIDLIFLPNLAIAQLPEDIPTVLTLHDFSWQIYPDFFSRKMQWWHKATRPSELIAKSRSIIVPSESSKRDCERLFATPHEKTRVIHHGVSPTFSDRMSASDHGVRSRLKLPKKFVLFVGTIEPRKNLLALIEGVKDYRDRTHDDLHMVIVGEWGWRSHAVRRRLWKRDTYGWIHQLGYVDASNLPAVYRSAQATIFPSIYEGFGLPILESLASGTPVITSHTSSMPEVGSDAAIYIDPYNSRDISEALRGLMGSSSLQKQLRERGIERASQFTWEKTARETLKVFQESVTSL
ncbi:MAG: glycosyltransferase family 4 protein [Candidatus Uhrbacteria bacterium]|nr:glycosyltransferase family 4 protein [Candidatus Uhrbacteria bacterium]